MVSEIAGPAGKGSVATSSRRRALVLGCGGTLGGAWMIAALLEVERALGWDARQAEVIVGTSAGAELAALLGTGTSVTTLVDAAIGAAGADPRLARHFASPPPSWPPLPGRGLTAPRLALGGLRGSVAPLVAATALLPIGRGDPSFLDAVTPETGWATHPATWIVAVDLETGKRVAFGKGRPAAGSEPSLRDAVRASWAIPGWFPPVTIGGHRHVDGGVASPASADLLTGADVDEVVLIAPMASSHPGRRRGLGRVEGLVRSAMTRTVDREVQALEAAGITVLRIEPSAEELAAIGPVLMDRARRRSVLEASLRTTRRTVAASLLERGDRSWA